MVDNTKIERIGSWEIEHFLKPEYIPSDVIFRLEKWLNNEWLKMVRKFPCEDRKHIWGGLKKFRIPSPIIRLETSTLQGGGIKSHIYSIGKRPTLGTLPLVTRYCPEHRKKIVKATAYSLDGLIQMGNKFVQDDEYLATEILRVPYYTKIPCGEAPENYHLNDEQLKEYQEKCLEGQYYWVRTDPHAEYSQELWQKLESISLVPVRADGCNSEFMELGMARRLSDGLFDLPWHKSFVIKPVQGTWGDNVIIYHFDCTEEEKRAAKEKIKNLIQLLGPEHLMLQPYIPTRLIEREGRKYYEIYKLYFAYLDNEGYTFTGGMVQGSPSEVVCGINGTYFIPLLTR
jgi:hypothetical protein